MSEVLASQREMLSRSGRKGGDLTDENLGRLFEQQLAQVKKMLAGRRIPTLYVAHRHALQRPGEVAERVRAFLGNDLVTPAMTAVVDPSLYHP